MTTPNPQNPGQPAPHFGAPGGWGSVPPPPVKSPSRGKAWLTHGVVGLVALIIGAAMGGSDGGGADASAGAGVKPGPTVTVTATAGAAPAPTVTKTEAAKPVKTEEAGPASSFEGDGEYLVGEDIKAGTYRTAGSDGAFGCYWERAKDSSGEFDSIIANENLQGSGRVTLKQGEIFKTNRCKEWKKVG
ncbi:hypothetical protein NLX86_09725 [Streptomyces sp. A3M-1-3]|uniref:hypothetical protein n=1 Tax=Streptomyces sp. A3M-1-3 TaxID=2962044 RepID=UPI0020B8CDB9|nr:hypothetical protein [Streptomyces sp. A3M-1-3]MCP3818384.1 hypothetical protein [Streptomyces sp. A3M-1-3]